MKPLLVLYATRDGYTRHIAEHVGATIVARGHAADVHDVCELREPFDVYRYWGAIIAASIHSGEHEREMVEFVKRHRDALEQVSSAFVSVSLTEAAAENARCGPALRDRADARVYRRIESFLEATGWRPRRVEPVAGALLYSRHGFLSRFVMMLRAKRRGTSTDTSRDHEYTDWEALDRFVDEFIVQTCEVDTVPGAEEKGLTFIG